MKTLRIARAASLLALLALFSPGVAFASATADPPFAASGYDPATIAEIWNSRSDPDGQFESREIVVPRVLILLVAGYPGREGVTLALERTSDKARLPLDAPEAGHSWQAVRFAIPREWEGARARIIASSDVAPWWIGVTTPVEAAPRGAGALRIPLLVLLAFTLFILPGLAALILGGRSLEAWARVALVVTASCLAGYAAFYVYFLSSTAGAVASLAMLLASALLVALRTRRAETRQLLRERALWLPFALMLLYALFVACLTYLHLPDWSDADEVPRHRFVRNLPGDNSLPQYLAENMWSGSDARRLIDGWLSSDRPPLQTGLVLLQRPVAEATASSPSLFAQITGIVAQSTWVAGIWVLCAVTRVRRGTAAVALAAAGVSGFFLLNTSFVWPKMLAGALALIAVAALVASRRDGWSTSRVAIGSASACLALLAHAGAAFTLIPAAIAFAASRPRPSLRSATLALALALPLVAPWILYQRCYAPPGNRLLLTNVAGETKVTDRTFLEAMAFNYRRVGADYALRARWKSAERLLPDLAPDALASAERRRTTAWNRVFGTLGVLNLAWLLVARRAFRRERSHDEIRRLYAVTAVSVAIPVIVLFGAGEATAHTASYAAIATLFVLAASELGALSRPAIAAIVSLQAAMFAVDWIALTPPRIPGSAIPVASIPLAFVALLAGAGFMALVARLWIASDAAPDAAGAYS